MRLRGMGLGRLTVEVLADLVRDRRDTLLAATNLGALGAEGAGMLPGGFLFALGIVTLLIGLYDFDILDLAIGVDSSYLGWRGRVGMVCYVMPIALAFLARSSSLGLLGGWISLAGALLFFVSVLLYAHPPPPAQLQDEERNALEEVWRDILANPDRGRDDLVLFWGAARVPTYRLAGIARIGSILTPYYASLLVLYGVIGLLESHLVLAVSLTVFIGLVAFLREWGSEGDGTGPGLARLEQLRGAFEGTLVSSLTKPLGAAMIAPLLFLLVRVLYVPAHLSQEVAALLGSGNVTRFEVGMTLDLTAYWLGGLLVPLFIMVGVLRDQAGKPGGTVGRPFGHLLGSALVVHLWWPGPLPWSLNEALQAVWPSVLLRWVVSPLLVLGVAVFVSFWIHRWIGRRAQPSLGLGLGLIAFVAFLVARPDLLGILPSRLPGVGLLLVVSALLGGGTWVLAHLADLAEEVTGGWDEETAEKEGWIVELSVGLLLAGYAIAHGLRYRMGQVELWTAEAVFVAAVGLVLGTLSVASRLESRRGETLGWILLGVRTETGEAEAYREAYGDVQEADPDTERS